MDKRDCRAALDLVFSQALNLAMAAGLPAVAAFQFIALVCTYATPSMLRRDRIPFQVAQEEFALLGVAIAVVAVWVLSSQYRIPTLITRLSRTWLGVLTDVATLFGAVSFSLFLSTVMSGSRVGFGFCVQPAFLAVVSASPMLALAPGLARSRLSPGPLVALLGLISICLLGFFGRLSPFRADTVFAATGSVARWSADGMASGACLLISVSLARSRFSDTRCG